MRRNKNNFIIICILGIAFLIGVFTVIYMKQNLMESRDVTQNEKNLEMVNDNMKVSPRATATPDETEIPREASVIPKATATPIKKKPIDWREDYKEVIWNLPNRIMHEESSLVLTLADVDQDTIPELLVGDLFGANMVYNLVACLDVDEVKVYEKEIEIVNNSTAVNEYKPYRGIQDGKIYWFGNYDYLEYAFKNDGFLSPYVFAIGQLVFDDDTVKVDCAFDFQNWKMTGENRESVASFLNSYEYAENSMYVSMEVYVSPTGTLEEYQKSVTQEAIDKFLNAYEKGVHEVSPLPGEEPIPKGEKAFTTEEALDSGTLDAAKSVIGSIGNSTDAIQLKTMGLEMRAAALFRMSLGFNGVVATDLPYEYREDENRYIFSVEEANRVMNAVFGMDFVEYGMDTMGNVDASGYYHHEFFEGDERVIVPELTAYKTANGYYLLKGRIQRQASTGKIVEDSTIVCIARKVDYTYSGNFQYLYQYWGENAWEDAVNMVQDL